MGAWKQNRGQFATCREPGDRQLYRPKYWEDEIQEGLNGPVIVRQMTAEEREKYGVTKNKMDG